MYLTSSRLPHRTSTLPGLRRQKTRESRTIAGPASFRRSSRCSAASSSILEAIPSRCTPLLPRPARRVQVVGHGSRRRARRRSPALRLALLALPLHRPFLLYSPRTAGEGPEEALGNRHALLEPPHRVLRLLLSLRPVVPLERPAGAARKPERRMIAARAAAPAAQQLTGWVSGPPRPGGPPDGGRAARPRTPPGPRPPRAPRGPNGPRTAPAPGRGR